MNTNDKAYVIQQSLKENGYVKLAGVIADYIEKNERHDILRLGFVGDDLVGKSTVINAFLGEKVVPETVLPSSAEISVNYGMEYEIKNQDGKPVDQKELLRLIEEDDAVSITVPNKILKNHGIEIKEFHGLLNRQKLSDMFWMSSIYKCDTIVLVMSAEHLLSENECAFIDNFIQYVGSDRLLLVVNKLTSVSNSDIDRVLEYTQKQISIKFPDVKWSVNDPESYFSGIVSKYTSTNVNDGIIGLCNITSDSRSYANNNILHFVRDELLSETDNLRDKKGKSEEEIKISNRKVLEQKELEKAAIENALIEFAQRRNTAVDKVDTFIKKEFADISDRLLMEYENATDRHAWYGNELEKIWKKNVFNSSERADEFITKIVTEDVEWLNGLLNTNLKSGRMAVEILDRQINSSDKLIPYKKYVSIGIGGGIIIGYCLFRMVGVVIGLGGGALAFSYLKFKEAAQDEEIQRGISAQIRDISSEVRKLTRIEIEKLYDEVLNEFKKEVDGILDSKYRIVNINTDDYERKITELQKIITKMEV